MAESRRNLHIQYRCVGALRMMKESSILLLVHVVAVCIGDVKMEILETLLTN